MLEVRVLPPELSKERKVMEWWGYLVLFTVAGGPWYVYWIYKWKVKGDYPQDRHVQWPW